MLSDVVLLEVLGCSVKLRERSIATRGSGLAFLTADSTISITISIKISFLVVVLHLGFAGPKPFDTPSAEGTLDPGHKKSCGVWPPSFNPPLLLSLPGPSHPGAARKAKSGSIISSSTGFWLLESVSIGAEPIDLLGAKLVVGFLLILLSHEEGDGHRRGGGSIDLEAVLSNEVSDAAWADTRL